MGLGSSTVSLSIPGRRFLITHVRGLGWFTSRMPIRFMGGLVFSFWWIIWSRCLRQAFGAGQEAVALFFWKKQLALLRHFFPAEKNNRPLADWAPVLALGQRLICGQNSGRIPPRFYSPFSNTSKVFMEINPIVTKIKELRERTESLRGYL